MFWENIQNNSYNLSSYYQLINFLNSKSNLAVIILFLWLVIASKFKKNITLLNKLLFLIIYFNVMFCDNYMNYSLSISTLFVINMNLLNGLMLIHPIILYMFYVFYLLEFKVNLFKKYNKTTKVILVRYKSIFLMFIICLSVILGCWWAEQELSWGGWWSWDFVELLALNFLLFTLLGIHSTKTQNDVKIIDGCSATVLLIIVAILVVRFNIINSVHNFISVESQNQYFYYILYPLFFMVLFVIFILRLNKIKNVVSSFFVINPYSCIIILMVILYMVIIYNIYIIQIFEFNYNVQTDIKSVYLYSLYLFLTVFFVGVGLIVKKYIYLVIVCNFFLSYVDYIFIYICTVVVYLKACNDTKKNSCIVYFIHLCLITFLWFTLHQLYNFTRFGFSTKFDTCTFIKTTYFSKIFLRPYNFGSLIDPWNSVFCKLSNFDKNNSSDASSGLFSNIFEKDIIVIHNLALELYSYNLQTLFQSIGGCMLIILLTLLILIWIYRKHKPYAWI